MRCGGIFEGTGIESKISELEAKTAEAGFWDDRKKSGEVIKDLSQLKGTLSEWQALIGEVKSADELCQLYAEEEDDAVRDEMEKNISSLHSKLSELKSKLLLSGKYDRNDCYLSIHAGAGGTEAGDWANMLMRMYLRFAERNGFKCETIDMEENEGGIKSCTILVKGTYAYGYLRNEAGVHRLIRISPFDANKRRHTSFASVYASPVVDDDIKINIKPEDIRIDTYRAGGAGGQHVNKTDSAVRITHFASGIVVQCQNERSQLMNKEVCFKMLYSKLWEYYHDLADEEFKKEAIEKKNIEWGSQIRTYTFQPYTLVKDHRTGAEAGNIQAVMDGDIMSFIESNLNNSDVLNVKQGK